VYAVMHCSFTMTPFCLGSTTSRPEGTAFREVKLSDVPASILLVAARVMINLELVALGAPGLDCSFDAGGAIPVAVVLRR
jgi:hypothetical protein